MTGERRCSAGFMSEEYNIDKLYWLLVELGIPVLNDDLSARPEEEIVNDLFRAWGAEPPNSYKIVGALNYMSSGGNFTDAQKLMLSIINEETNDEEKRRIEEESDRALEEFLDSFPIIGGDAE